MKSISQALTMGLIQRKVPFFANDNISKDCGPQAIAGIQLDVEKACENLLKALVIDTKNDHNTKETAKRMAKMFVREVFRGRYEPMPPLKSFPNVKAVDEIYLVGPITIRSGCSHHMVPIMGKAWIGVIPGERLIGLSKFNRLTDWVFARPQIQEEATQMLADIISDEIAPKGLAIIVEAQHLCMTWRGVRESETTMTTSVMRGALREDAQARNEFLNLVRLKSAC